jgi:hypothetical protein
MARSKEEKAAYKRAYYLANKEKHRQQSKTWSKANPEKVAAKNKTWCLANPEKRVAANKKHLLKLNIINKNISRRTLTAWSAQVKEAVSFCEWCYSEDSLEAHHILPKAEFPQHALDVKNGRTMCSYCHTMIHKQGDF